MCMRAWYIQQIHNLCNVFKKPASLPYLSHFVSKHFCTMTRKFTRILPCALTSPIIVIVIS